jgi:hypothetical protein
VLTEGEVLFNTASDQWIHLTIKADEPQTKDTMTTEPTLDANHFTLNNETRNAAYAFLKANPGYNIEDSGSPLFTIIGQMGLNCAKDKDPVTEIILSSHGYSRFLGCNELIMCLEPVTRFQEMIEGKVGSLLGSTVYTEAYTHPLEQTMAPSDILFRTLSNKWFRIYAKNTSSANV